MAPVVALPLFFASLALTLLAAGLFARRLDELGMRLGFPEALLGLLTALAADGPEISSALIALAKGARGVSLGVVVGSNVFNLAAMVGVSALVAGSVHLRREALLLEGLVGALATVIVTSLVLGVLSAMTAAVLLVCVLLPYLAVLIGGAELAARVPLPERIAGGLVRALSERTGSGAARITTEASAWKTPVLIPFSIVLILLGSAGMVETALTLADRWQVPATVVGFLILAPLTSIPNAATAIRLGVAGRGSALVGDTFNSNTINLVVGVAVPALLVSIASVSTGVEFDLAWMVGMTAATLALLAQPRGVGRRGALVLITLYLVFVAVAITSG